MEIIEKSTGQGDIGVNKKNILIVGGFGFLGSALVKELLRNHNLTILDCQEYALSPLGKSGIDMNNVKIIHGDASIFHTFDDMGLDYDYIVNVAAFLGINAVASKSIYTICNNIDITRNLLDFAVQQKHLEKYIEFSSSEIYGINAINNLEEAPAVIEDARGARWCYAAAKTLSEHITFAYSREKGLPVVVIRPFNIFGEYRTGENAISQFAYCLIRNEPILIKGNGRQVRDWCYIDDFVAFFRLLLESNCINQIFNVGNPSNCVSVLELAIKMKKIFCSESEIVITESSEPDVYIRKTSIEKAKSLLGFYPLVDLETGLKNIYDYLMASVII